MDQALAAIHEGNPQRLPVVLSFGRHAQKVGMYWRIPDQLESIAEGQLLAHYPDAFIERLPDGALDAPPGCTTWHADLHLAPDILPLRRYPEFAEGAGAMATDPLAGILTAVAVPPAGRISACVDLEIRPAHSHRVHRAHRILARCEQLHWLGMHHFATTYLRMRFSSRRSVRLIATLIEYAMLGPMGRSPHPPSPSSRSHDREDIYQAAHSKLSQYLFEARLRLRVFGPGANQAEARRKLQELGAAFGQVGSARLAAFETVRVRARRRALRRAAPTFLLSSEEVATLWHPAISTVRAATMDFVGSRELEPPPMLPTPKDDPAVAVLGRALFRHRRERFGMRPDDRRRHLAVLGKTGMGKSTLLCNLLAGDIAAGRGVTLIDPHGDLAEEVVRMVPPHRTNDVILFDAGDIAYPLSFNVLAGHDIDRRPLVASGVLSAFKKLYSDSWGPRLEHIFRNCLLALLEVPGTSLTCVLPLLGDSRYRQSVVQRLRDPTVRAFWEREFAALPPKLRAEAIAPIQNKVGQFVTHPVLRNIIGQKRQSLDLRRVLDSGQVLIANLSKGRIGEDASGLLGALLITSIQIAAMQRADQPEHGRRDAYLYIDEFQNFATDSFATILSEARKFRLNLTLANQYLAQLDQATMDALFGNVGSLLCFQVGPQDAEVLAEQLGGDAVAQDLLNLPKYSAYARLLIDGHPSRPFSMTTLKPMQTPSNDDRSDIIRRTSRHRYAKPVAEVEADLREALAA